MSVCAIVSLCNSVTVSVSNSVLVSMCNSVISTVIKSVNVSVCNHLAGKPLRTSPPPPPQLYVMDSIHGVIRGRLAV